MSDYISREAAIETLDESIEMIQKVLDDTDVVGLSRERYAWGLGLLQSEKADIEEIPAADVVEVIRCRDCRWWDKRDDVMGYCMAAKHGYWSRHWEITIYRTYDGDFYCADAERRENGHNGDD